MHLAPGQSRRLLPLLERLARVNGYGKIIAKVPRTHWHPFQSAGYIQEAVIPGLFDGRVDGLFAAKFFSRRRRRASGRTRQEGVATGPAARPGGIAGVPSVSVCTPEDADALAAIYRRVFASYAFPIHRPAYLRRMMARHARYYCIRFDRRPAAAAAAEIDAAGSNCEMTDFATLPEHGGRGLAQSLLRRMEREVRNRGVKTAYTIARADSRPMNRVFAKTGYRYAGRLTDNTQIAGRIRSMNVWYKWLTDPTADR